MLMQRMGTRKPKVGAPVPLARLGAAVMEVALKKPPITRAALGLFDFAPLSFDTYLATHGIES